MSDNTERDRRVREALEAYRQATKVATDEYRRALTAALEERSVAYDVAQTAYASRVSDADVAFDQFRGPAVAELLRKVDEIRQEYGPAPLNDEVAQIEHNALASEAWVAYDAAVHAAARAFEEAAVPATAVYEATVAPFRQEFNRAREEAALERDGALDLAWKMYRHKTKWMDP